MIKALTFLATWLLLAGGVLLAVPTIWSSRRVAAFVRWQLRNTPYDHAYYEVSGKPKRPDSPSMAKALWNVSIFSTFVMFAIELPTLAFLFLMSQAISGTFFAITKLLIFAIGGALVYAHFSIHGVVTILLLQRADRARNLQAALGKSGLALLFIGTVVLSVAVLAS